MSDKLRECRPSCTATLRSTVGGRLGTLPIRQKERHIGNPRLWAAWLFQLCRCARIFYAGAAPAHESCNQSKTWTPCSRIPPCLHDWRSPASWKPSMCGPGPTSQVQMNLETPRQREDEAYDCLAANESGFSVAIATSSMIPRAVTRPSVPELHGEPVCHDGTRARRSPPDRDLDTAVCPTRKWRAAGDSMESETGPAKCPFW